jgi:pyruvate, water dikinase
VYEHPVDIEFTLNFLGDGSYRIHLLQCRTFQIRREVIGTSLPVQTAHVTLLTAHGAVIGVSREQPLSRIIYIVTDKYAALPEQARHAVARLIGKLNRLHAAEDRGLMLIGPGRWGTHSPSLGIPVSFTEISRASVVCEVVAMHDNLIPDVSLGTHFFNDLVEHDMLYVAYFPKKAGNSINDEWFRQATNRLLELDGDAASLADVVRVIECSDVAQRVWLRADTTEQEALVFIRP